MCYVGIKIQFPRENRKIYDSLSTAFPPRNRTSEDMCCWAEGTIGHDRFADAQDARGCLWRGKCASEYVGRGGWKRTVMVSESRDRKREIAFRRLPKEMCDRHMCRKIDEGGHVRRHNPLEMSNLGTVGGGRLI